MPHNLNIVALVSIGRHPKSGRARRAEEDARAVELGLKLAGGQLRLLHAGDPGEPVLRRYLGMGLNAMTVLAQPAVADAAGVLGNYLADKRPDILLTGVRAESGEASGMMPYLLAEALGWPVISRIAAITGVENGEADILQALPRGQRRALRVSLPFVASVDSAAEAPRQSAYGPGLRAAIEVIQGAVVEDRAREAWTVTAARKRPKRLQVVKAKSAADRFRAATAKSRGDAGRVLKDSSAVEQARAILDLLIEEGVLG